MSSEYSFIVSSYWRSPLNIGNLRHFSSLEQAWNHGVSLMANKEPDVKIYLITETKEPYCFRNTPCFRKIYDHVTRSFIDNVNLDSEEAMFQKALLELDRAKKKLGLE